MTDDEMFEAANRRQHVAIKAADYTYVGWVVGAFCKMRGPARCVVEDQNGRLFIHNAGQLSSL